MTGEVAKMNGSNFILEQTIFVCKILWSYFYLLFVVVAVGVFFQFKQNFKEPHENIYSQ